MKREEKIEDIRRLRLMERDLMENFMTRGIKLNDEKLKSRREKRNVEDIIRQLTFGGKGWIREKLNFVTGMREIEL